MFRLLLAVVLAAGAVAAQTTSADARPGSVSGIVRDASTRAPLAGAHVSIRGVDGVKADGQGQFEISKVPPGRQWVSVYDAGRAASGGLAVLVAPGESAEIEVLVKVGGAITGRVTDGDAPVAGVSVVLLERHFEFGQLVYAPLMAVATNSDGGYRLQPVPAEQTFLILARKPLKESGANADAPPDPGKRPPVPIPTYYPSARFAEGAQPVTLMPGETLRGIDIRIASTAPFCIEGELDVPAEARLKAVTITQTQALVSGVGFTPAEALLSERGAFRGCGLAPGEYRLSAISDTGVPRASRVYAFARVSILDHDLAGVKLLIRHIADVAGDTVWDPAPKSNDPAAKPLVEVFRSFADNHADEAKPPSYMGGKMSMGDYVDIPGPFRLTQIIPDDYELGIRGLPQGCYLKEASYGGIDVLHNLLRLSTQDGRLRLVVACDSGRLTAQVSDREGNPVANSHFYLMPEGAASEGAMNSELRGWPVEHGWATSSTPLPPGKYQALACDLETDGTAEAVLKLWRARSKATPVEIRPGGAAQIRIELVDVN